MKARQRERYANDPKFREKHNEYLRKQAEDPEFQKKKNAYHRERRKNDPEYRMMREVRSLIERVEKGGKRSLEILRCT